MDPRVYSNKSWKQDALRVIQAHRSHRINYCKGPSYKRMFGGMYPLNLVLINLIGVQWKQLSQMIHCLHIWFEIIKMIKHPSYVVEDPRNPHRGRHHEGGVTIPLLQQFVHDLMWHHCSHSTFIIWTATAGEFTHISCNHWRVCPWVKFLLKCLDLKGKKWPFSLAS